MNIETLEIIRNLPSGTISAHSMRTGVLNDEPLLRSMDGALRYAKAYEMRFGSKVADDYALRDHFLDWIKGVRGLLNGDGAVAMERDISTDSKDNGAIESIFWACMKAGGFTEGDL